MMNMSERSECREEYMEKKKKAKLQRKQEKERIGKILDILFTDTNINLSGRDTSNVTTMKNMFSNCSSLT